ncbi:RHS repeat domain-containing protein [Spirosoma foliorum]|uniref:RHS repeat protein n=1 Tax=Spirosoma foliorum TaxID=2710596 RepID=A0A7G5GVG0_9BACT|nr:RHS repeat domain-containing protein [Spirosoma foliorum]QMW02852.1 RHS repeat protein [Spirosoma foliorum]
MLIFLFRRTLLVCLVGLCPLVFAQKLPGDSATTAPVNQPSLVATLSDLLPQITPKSPTVAALGRYGEYPVSMYTGLPSIEIPIHEFKVGTLTVPIKLTYHASGLKVNDLASWVGMGWSLQTGGLITRNVLSRPDEQDTPTTGVLNRSIVSPTYDPSCPTDATDLPISNLATNLVDSQRDLFAYRTPAGSNTFILPTLSSPVFLSPEPVSLTASSGLSSFTLVDASGTQFRYADAETTFTNPTSSNAYASFTSAWHLSEIVSLNSSERAIYTYTSALNQPSAPEPTDTWVVLANLSESSPSVSGIQTGISSQTHRNASVQVGTRLPNEIQFPGGKLRFVLEAQARPDGGYALDYIDLMSYDITSGDYALIKRFDFQYVNKNRTDGSSVTFLDQIQLLQNDGATSLGAYTFTYNATPLSAAGGNAKDFWGYYNGQLSTTLLAKQSFVIQENANNPSVTTFTIGDANRDPNESLMKAWVLQSIRYPTGGSTQFDFETNRYNDNGVKLAGGLRIHQIRSYTADNQLATTKTYRYGVNESGWGTFRSKLVNTYTTSLKLNNYQPAPGAPNFSYYAYTFSSSPTYPLSPDDGSPVTYAEVAEYAEDGSGNTTGKTLSQFRDAASDGLIQLAPGKTFLTSRSWDRGQLENRTVTDANGNLQSKLVQAFSTIASGSTTDLAGILVQRSVQQIGAKQATNGCNTIDDAYLPFQTYLFNYGLTKLTGSSEYTYADDNSGRYTVKTTLTDYSPVYYLPFRTQVVVEGPANQGNAIVGTLLSYPQDFGSIPANASSPELQGIRALQTRNVYLPIEEVHFRQEAGSSNWDYKTGKLTTYTPTTLNGLTTALPYRTYRMESLYNSFPANNPYRSSAQRYTASGSASSFPTDPRMVLRLTMTNYDANGNLTRYELTNGAATAFGYDTYTPGGGVQFSVVNQQTLNAGQANAQSSTYSYTRPLLGPRTTTDPRGVTTTYEYDAFGRLATIKDKDGNVLKNYSYHYATQP